MNKVDRSALRGTTAIAACLTALAFAHLAFAADREPPPAEKSTQAKLQGSQIEQVVVTARRRAERLQRVPISISVLNQRELNERNITQATDLAKYTPSLSVNPTFGSESTSFALRGFSQDIGTSPTVAAYFADVVAPRGGYLTAVEHAGDGLQVGDFFDVANIQVLKGPQGTLFGRNTTGGAILVVPQRPTDKFSGYYEQSLGNYGLNREQGVLNIPISPKVLFRIGFDRESRDGYENNITNIGPRRFGDTNYQAFRASLIMKLSDDVENYTIVSYNKSDTAGIAQQIFACSPSVPIIGALSCGQYARDRVAQAKDPWAVDNDDPFANANSRSWQAINTTTWQATDDLSVKNIASYSSLEQVLNSSLFGSDWIFPSVVSVPFGNKTFRIPTGPLAGQHIYYVTSGPTLSGNSVDQRTYSDELQAHGVALNNRFDWQAGIYAEASQPQNPVSTISPTILNCPNFYAKDCTDTIGSIGTLFGLPVSPVGNLSVTKLGELSTRDYGVYGQGTYTITPQLKTTFGIRYTWDTEAGQGERTSYIFLKPNTPTAKCGNPQLTLANNCYLNLHNSSSAPTATIDLDYTPSSEVLLYAKYSRGYRQGGVLPSGAFGFYTYQPDLEDAFELGGKTSWSGPVPGVFDIALFYNSLSNEQIEATFYPKPGAANTVTSGVVNAGSSRIYGTEIGATLVPFTGLTIRLDYAYLNSKLEQLSPVVFPASSPYGSAVYSSVAGSPLATTPRNKITATGTYRLPLDPDIGKVSFGATYVYNGSEYAGGGAYAYIPAYQILNLNASWDEIYRQPVDLQFFMTNVTNNAYASYVIDEAAQVGLVGRNLGEPRMFGFRLRYHFG